MSYSVHGAWMVVYDAEFDSLDEALEAARSMAAEHPSAPFQIVGPDFSGHALVTREKVTA